MKHFAALLLCFIAACGAEPEPGVSLGLSLSSDVAGRISQLQVAFVKAGSIDCERVRTACLKSVGVQTIPVAGSQQGKPAWTVPFTASQAGTALAIQVAAGTYLLNVEALDSAGQLVANACKLKVDLTAGATTEVTLPLVEYAGPACDARL